MQEIINEIAQKAGISPDKATLIVGLILAFLKKEGPQAAVSKLFAAFPEADAIATAATAKFSGGLGSIVGGLGSLLGGKAGDTMELITELLGTGVSMAQLEKAGEILLSAVRAEAGPKVVNDILAHVPALSKIAPKA